jgi:hypothetical protein
LYNRNQPGEFFMTVYAETKFVLEGNVRLQVEQAPMCLPGAPAASVTAPAVQAATGKGTRPAEAPKPPGSAGAPKELSMSVSQFLDKKEDMRAKIVAEMKRLNVSAGAIEAIFASETG